MTRVTLAHLRTVPGVRQSPGYCVPGARTWFARHGLSFGDFARHGLDEAVLVATGDPLALRLVEHARQQEGR